MGKRELLLIVGFLLVGIVVYQATAAPESADARGLFASLSRFVDHARREMRGNRAVAERTEAVVHPVDESITEVRISEYVREVHVTGEERSDVEASLHVVSNAYDDREARETADGTTLRTERAAASLLMRIDYPRPGRQHTTLRVKVPARLHVRVESRPDTLVIDGVASVDVADARGATTIRNVAGRVAVTHQGGTATVEDVASLRFTGRHTRLTVQGVREEAEFDIEQGGAIRASRLGGRVEVESRNAEIALQDPGEKRGSVRINASGGSVSVERLRSDTRIDGRNARVEVTMSEPAPVAIYSNGAPATLTPPRTAYTLDAAATNGRITPATRLEELGLLYDSRPEPPEERANGPVGGGGPTVTVRTTRADIVLRTPE